MTYIWRAQERRDKIIVHIHKPDWFGHPSTAAICGVRMEFNRRHQHVPYNLGRPVCKNCLRSCVDERIAA